jgi:hypothetical protein
MKTPALAVALTAVLAATALAGAPWVSVEFRANPLGANRDGYLVLRTYHHAEAVGYPLRGTAEGIVNGHRTSIPLRFDVQHDEAGVFILTKVWSDGTSWVLNVGLDAGEHFGAGVVIGIGASGDPAFVRFPRTLDGMTRVASAREVDAMLQALAQGREPPQLARAGIGDFIMRNPGPAAALAGMFLAAATITGLAGALVRRLRHGRSGAESA